MKLSICVLFCDKDCHLAEKLSEKIVSCCSGVFDKEILFLDNRENNHDELHFNEDVKVFSAGYNTYQLQGRKFLVSKATGDYIWFIDADDDIFYVDNDFLSIANQLKYDVISFSYMYENLPNKEWKKAEFGPEYHINEKYGAQAWNKWFKRDILNKVETYVPEGLKVVASEDLILVVGASKFAQNSIYVPDILYKFNTEASMSGCKSIHSIDAFKHIMFGREDANKVMLSIVGDEYSFKTITTNDATFFLYKAGICDNDLQEQALDILEQQFSLDTLVDAWATSQYMMDLKQSYIIWYRLNKRWPNRFKYYAIAQYSRDDSEIIQTKPDGTRIVTTVGELKRLNIC